jgi:hypothetical protein
MRAERAQRDPNAALNCGYSRALAAFDDRPAAHLRQAQS